MFDFYGQHPYKQMLENLRQDIVLNSLYYHDYENRYGMPREDVSVFFDGFLDYIEEEMEVRIPGFSDEHFFDYLSEFDTIENLIDWFEICQWYIGGIDVPKFFEAMDLQAA